MPTPKTALAFARTTNVALPANIFFANINHFPTQVFPILPNDLAKLQPPVSLSHHSLPILFYKFFQPSQCDNLHPTTKSRFYQSGFHSNKQISVVLCCQCNQSVRRVLSLVSLSFNKIVIFLSTTKKGLIERDPSNPFFDGSTEPSTNP